ncbi:hypothetical protein GCK72_008627 [Caenorhabditis remanei]|uniref:Uncharacterized protein n=1 Tax=Caenorhabditis remanei TaxID=31234 RepID=A0A6A5GY23_CAERE|nr:hypothetical protein GCK72_008627 [Caenorhabditis remanei]KAF1760378.1 hypothetical protein GCK72_008627 [Caenorhabditis remanei]
MRIQRFCHNIHQILRLRLKFVSLRFRSHPSLLWGVACRNWSKVGGACQVESGGGTPDPSGQNSGHLDKFLEFRTENDEISFISSLAFSWLFVEIDREHSHDCSVTMTTCHCSVDELQSLRSLMPDSLTANRCDSAIVRTSYR